MQSEFIDTLLSDWGWGIAILLGIFALWLSMYVFLTQKGLEVKASGPFAGWRQYIRGPKWPAVALLFVGLALACATLAAFSFYNEIITGPPYIATDIGNFVFMGGVMVLIVSIFTLALALMKTFGGMAYARRG